MVIGGSAGGIDALLTLVQGLPRDLNAAVFVVIHSANDDSQLPGILARRGKLRAVHAQNGEIFQRGCIYVAPPDVHMLLDPERIRLLRGPKENRHRPAVDPLFRTAAEVHGPRVIGVILSGSLADGTAGLIEVKKHGGLAVVQDLSDAIIQSMPQSAINQVKVDHVVPSYEMGALLARLCAAPITLEQEEEEEEIMAGSNGPAPPGRATPEEPPAGDGPSSHQRGLTCPECGGVVLENQGPGIPRFTCRTGHAFSAEALLDGQSEVLENALWAALRTLEERREVAERMARSARSAGHSLSEKHFLRTVSEANERAALIRALLRSLDLAPEPSRQR